MSVHDVHLDGSPEVSDQDRELGALWQRVVGRRSFLKQAGIAGAAGVPLRRSWLRPPVRSRRGRPRAISPF
jgi:hypothetical protein